MRPQHEPAPMAWWKTRGAYEVLQRVAREQRIPMAYILGDRKPEEVSRARKALYRALFAAGYSISEISRLTGRDRTSVRYGLIEVSKTRADGRGPQAGHTDAGVQGSTMACPGAA